MRTQKQDLPLANTRKRAKGGSMIRGARKAKTARKAKRASQKEEIKVIKKAMGVKAKRVENPMEVKVCTKIVVSFYNQTFVNIKIIFCF